MLSVDRDLVETTKFEFFHQIQIEFPKLNVANFHIN